MKYKLYSTEGEWNAKEAEIMSNLGIPTPDGQTLRYAEIEVVNNPESSDFEKYLFPVLYQGRWETNEYFDDSELVDGDPNWFLSPPPE